MATESPAFSLDTHQQPSTPKEPPAKRVRQALAEGNPALAEHTAQQALDNGATSPILRRLWIQATNAQGKHQLALERAREAVQLHPAHAHPSNPSLHQQYAQLLANAGDTEQALTCLKQALATKPDDIGLQLLQIKLLPKVGCLNQALDGLRQLRQQQCNNLNALLGIANFYQSHGRTRVALSVT